jgi:hypothetical protein
MLEHPPQRAGVGVHDYTACHPPQYAVVLSGGNWDLG